MIVITDAFDERLQPGACRTHPRAQQTLPCARAGDQDVVPASACHLCHACGDRYGARRRAVTSAQPAIFSSGGRLLDSVHVKLASAKHGARDRRRRGSTSRPAAARFWVSSDSSKCVGVQSFASAHIASTARVNPHLRCADRGMANAWRRCLQRASKIRSTRITPRNDKSIT